MIGALTILGIVCLICLSIFLDLAADAPTVDEHEKVVAPGRPRRFGINWTALLLPFAWRRT